MVQGELKSLRITLEAREGGILGYVYLADIAPGQAKETVEVEPNAIMSDYDAAGNLLGVEFLAAERADAAVMRGLAEKLKAPELAGIDLAQMCKSPA